MGLPVIKEQNSQYNAKLTLQLSACILLDVLDGIIRRKKGTSFTGSSLKKTVRSCIDKLCELKLHCGL